MSKNLIVLSDGTGNSSAFLAKTNVWRLYQALDLTGHDQIAMYDDGVGTSKNKYLAMLGGAFGWGLKRNVLQLYMFLCRNYRPGDRIYGFGFSRGAFTIRVLIGFVLKQRLVGYGDEEELYRRAKAAYRDYRRERFRRDAIPAWIGRTVRDCVLGIWSSLRGYTYDKLEDRTDVGRIRFLGLWDTVDAYGLPIDELTVAVDRWIWPLRFDDAKPSRKIDRACHALALDDERTTFHPVLWDESEEGDDVPSNIADERVSQVWFAGVHSNVGGGYSDDGLAHVSLDWMMEQAARAELRFIPAARSAASAAASPLGRLYDSRSGFGIYYRYGPRQSERAVYRGRAAPKIHESVVTLMAASGDRYASIAMPADCRIVSAGGGISPIAAHLRQLAIRHELAPPAPEALARVRDAVWARKVTYYLFLGVTLLLVVLPWMHWAGLRGAGGPIGTLNTWANMLAGPPLGYAKAMVPEFLSPAKTLFAWYAANGLIFVALAVVLGLLWYWSGHLQSLIRDRVGDAWRAPARIGAAAAAPQPPSVAYRIRKHPLSNRVYKLTTRSVAPAVVLAVAAYLAYRLTRCMPGLLG